MHTIETTGGVTADHKLLINSSVPEDVRPGEHNVTLTIDTDGPQHGRGAPFFRPAYPIGLTNSDSTFRREDIYNDVDR